VIASTDPGGIGALDTSIKLYGIELNARMIAWARSNVVLPN
jgi:hypothetical protein